VGTVAHDSGIVDGVVVTVDNGVPGQPHILPDLGALQDVACWSDRECVAVGGNADLDVMDAVVLPIVDGVPGEPQRVSSAASFSGVACPGPGECVAVGFDYDGLGVVARIDDGLAATASTVAGTESLRDVACVSDGTCLAVGSESTKHAALVPIADGEPGEAETITTVGTLTDVACHSAEDCIAVGQTDEQGEPHAAVVAISSGTAATPVTLAGLQMLEALSCPSKQACLGVGWGTQGKDYGGATVAITGAKPAAPASMGTVFSLDGVACPAEGGCIMVGRGSHGGLVMSAEAPAASTPSHSASLPDSPARSVDDQPSSTEAAGDGGYCGTPVGAVAEQALAPQSAHCVHVESDPPLKGGNTYWETGKPPYGPGRNLGRHDYFRIQMLDFSRAPAKLKTVLGGIQTYNGSDLTIRGVPCRYDDSLSMLTCMVSASTRFDATYNHGVSEAGCTRGACADDDDEAKLTSIFSAVLDSLGR
jgi:hypothetical protein